MFFLPSLFLQMSSQLYVFPTMTMLEASICFHCINCRCQIVWFTLKCLRHSLSLSLLKAPPKTVCIPTARSSINPAIILSIFSASDGNCITIHQPASSFSSTHPHLSSSSLVLRAHTLYIVCLRRSILLWQFLFISLNIDNR